ncbi:MAG: hypothetical protein RL113_948 [Pseudomonadota bacterium]
MSDRYCVSGTLGSAMPEKISLPIANTSKRISAFVIDDMVISVFLMVIFFDQLSALFSNISVLDEETVATLNYFFAENIGVIFTIKILYHTLFVWQNGMTLGKYLMKIKVIDLETKSHPSLPKAFLRSILRIGSEVLFYIGFLIAFFTPLRQTMHDKFANCVVIHA